MILKNLWFEDDKIFILTDTGETVWQSLLWYPRLMRATASERLNYRTNAFGIHWDEIDEDISFESFLYEEKEPNNIAKLFRQYPELNASAIARRLGMKQSLLAAYINGAKNPSAQRTKEVMEGMRLLAYELLSAM